MKKTLQFNGVYQEVMKVGKIINVNGFEGRITTIHAAKLHKDGLFISGVIKVNKDQLCELNKRIGDGNHAYIK